MAKYSTEVRTICESLAGLDDSVGYNDIDTVIANSYNRIFDNFPIFDNSYRATLCSKILKHYYTREIGAESFGLWKLQLNRRMNEIMPYYNKLYESERLNITPLKNYDGGSNRTLNKTGTTSGTEQSTGSGTKTGTVDHLHTGGFEDDTIHENEHVKTGGKESVTAGKITDVKSGGETNERNGVVKDENTKAGNTTDTREVLSGSVTTDFTDLFTDTPQGNINNMRNTPSGGTGDPIVGVTTGYLTTAEKTSNTVTDTQKIKNTKAFSNDYKDTNTRTYTDLTDEKEYDERNEKTYDDLSTNEVYNNITDTDEGRTTNTRTYSNDDILDTYNLQDTSTGSVTKSGQTSGTDTERYTDSGYRGITESEMLELYRKTFLNIDMDIIKELKDLFMLVW